nr:universal stress protein [Pseudonocardia acidicola]
MRIYLGAAPGVGKTYAMLAEGLRRRSRGTDVVIGLVEPHGRRVTAALAEGLETVPRRSITYRGGAFTEMDLDAVLARHPEVALVDELAHTNVPGSRNARRWQDVAELLDAGIDVVSTLNIQHLESLNDVVEQITGIRQQETIPDDVVRRADQIELVDMTPEALRRRMVHGNVYPPDRVETALTHYFRPGNLTALRELALLWVADRVEEVQQRYRTEHGIADPWETRERIVVGLRGDPRDQALIRRAARIAARTPGSDLLAVHVVGSEAAVAADAGRLAESRALVESGGGTLHQLIGDDVAEALVRFAEAENATQIVLGATPRGPLVAALAGEAVSTKVVRLAGATDVHIVTRRPDADLGRPIRRPRRSGRGPVVPVLVLIGLAGVLAALRVGFGPGAAGALVAGLVADLLAVLAIAAAGGLWPAVVAAVVAVLLTAVFLGPPVSAGLLALGVLGVIAVAAGTAVDRADRATRRAARAAAVAAALRSLTTAVVDGRDHLPVLLEQIRELLGLASVSLLAHDGAAVEPRWFVVASTGADAPEHPEDGDVEVPVGATGALVGRGRALGPTDEDVFLACAAQLEVLLRRVPADAGAGREAEAEVTRSAVLLILGRALRALLADVRSAVDTLGTPGGSPAQVQEGMTRMNRLVTELLDVSRLDAGALDVRLRTVDLDDVLVTALDELGPAASGVAVGIGDDVPVVVTDAAVLSRAVSTVVADALRRGAGAAPPSITVEAAPGKVDVRIVDRAGYELDDRAEHATRLAADLTEAAGGTMRVLPSPGGRTVVLTVPRAERPRTA